jgi:hypothetical protein
MTVARVRFVLLALLLAWMVLTWPNLEEQWGTTRKAWAALGGKKWEERGAVEWPAGFRAVREIGENTPADACVVVVARTSPQKLEYYRARFPYYLYPRRVRLSDQVDAAGVEGCGYVAVFREEGQWDEEKLKARLAGRSRVFAGEQVEIYR